MVAIEHRQKSASPVTDPNTTNANSSAAAILSPTSPVASTTSSASAASTTTSSIQQPQQKSPVAVSNINIINNNNNHNGQKMSATQELQPADAVTVSAADVADADNAADGAAAAEAAVVEVATNSKGSAVSQRHVDVKIAKSKANKDVVSKELTKKVLKLDLAGSKELDEYSIKSPKSPITARLPHQTSLTSSVDVEDRKTLREALYQGIFHRHRRTIFAVGSFLRMLRSRNSQYNTIRSSSEGEDVDETR